MNEFLEQVALSSAQGPLEGEAVPCVEASRKIVEFYNRANIKGFDKAGYFMFQGVKVYEKGKREEADARDNRSTEEVNHGMRNVK